MEGKNFVAECMGTWLAGIKKIIAECVVAYIWQECMLRGCGRKKFCGGMYGSKLCVQADTRHGDHILNKNYKIIRDKRCYRHKK